MSATESPAHLLRPVGTRVKVCRIGCPDQPIGVGTVAEVLRADPARGDYCRVLVDHGTEVGQYLRYADELPLATD